jgi:hypothetical protein
LDFLVLVGAQEANLGAVLEADGELRLVGLDGNLVPGAHRQEFAPQELLGVQAGDCPQPDEGHGLC